MYNTFCMLMQIVINYDVYQCLVFIRSVCGLANLNKIFFLHKMYIKKKKQCFMQWEIEITPTVLLQQGVLVP